MIQAFPIAGSNRASQFLCKGRGKGRGKALRWLLICMACLFPSLGMAQTSAGPSLTVQPDFDPSRLSDEELLGLLRQFETRKKLPQRTAILGVPTAFGAARGQFFLSLSATNRRDRRRLGDWDASLAMGIGLGDAQRWIGITPVIEITSVSPYHFGSSGKIGVKLSRHFSLGGKWYSAAALGLKNLVTWGDSNVLDPEWDLTLSSLRPADGALGVPVLVSAGYGSAVSNFGTDPGFYAGLGVGLRDNFGVSLGWFGDEAIAGASFWPDPKRNLMLSVGIGDILNNVSSRRLLLSVTIGKRFGPRK